MMTNESNASVASGPASSRGERIAKIGTVISAILASSCCWLPPLLLAVGVSGAGIVSTLGEYRWVAMTVTFSFLAMAFYFTYRPRRAVAGQADCCTPEADCCAPKTGVDGKRKRFSMMAVNKVMLWMVTVMALVFLFFPKYLTSMLSTDDGGFTDDMTLTEFKVGGMYCEGCVPTAEEAIREVAGVLAVKIDYSTGLAKIGTAFDTPVPSQEISAKLESLKFSEP
jgi:copper chaperone CopZ